MNNVIGFILAVIVGAGSMYALQSTAPVAKSDEPVVLGHRIGPNGQEMLVYAK